jgi:translation initiation factor IF-2
VGDAFVVGPHWGRVRALLDDRGKPVKEAKPSMPVLVLGADGLPSAGDTFAVVENEKKAREISERRQEELQAREVQTTKKLSLDELYARIEQGELKELRLVIKGDTNGTVEALRESLGRLTVEDIKVRVIHSGVGFITESDVLLASSSNALVIGFNVKASPKAKEMAKRERVEIRRYDVIYECIDEVKKALAGMLEPEYVERITGKAEVRKVIPVSKLGAVAGSLVLEGTIVRNAQVRVRRDGEVIYEGRITSLRRFKDDVREVRKDFECGIGIEGFSDFQEGDILETYVVEEKSKLV